MAKGPGRRYSQTTHAAKLHRNAAKRSRVVDTSIVHPCRRKRLPRFCGPKYSKLINIINNNNNNNNNYYYYYVNRSYRTQTVYQKYFLRTMNYTRTQFASDFQSPPIQPKASRGPNEQQFIITYTMPVKRKRLKASFYNASEKSIIP